jgi:hypothetical protein
MLHYFSTHGARIVSGYLGSEFWLRTVFRASHDESAVRYALVALSLLHLDSGVANRAKNKPNEEALLQYSKAVRVLHKRLKQGGQRSHETALICSVLFYSFESALENIKEAIQHLDNGLRILQSVSPEPGSAPAEGVVSQLTDVLSRMDLQASMYDDNRDLSLVLVSPEERQTGISDFLAGDNFRDEAEALFWLNKLQNWFWHLLTDNLQFKFRSMEDIPQALLEEKGRLSRHLDRWAERFSDIRKNIENSECQSDTLRGSQLLIVHHQITQMLLASNLPLDLSVFGSGSSLEPRNLLQMIQSILYNDQNTAHDSSDSVQQRFSSETGVIAPLFLLAMKSTDNHIVENAAKLLESCHRREGLHHARAIFTVLRRLNEVREEREAIFEQVELALIPLEYWTIDMIDSRTGGLDTIGI